MSKLDKLETPYWVYGSLGYIDLDPCAGVTTNIANENWAIERGQDGLERDWYGFVYCNPPFSQKELWTQKMIEHGNGILILPERGSAPWFGPLAMRTVLYWTMGEKINFIGGPSSNNLGSVLFLFGSEAMNKVLHSGLPGHLSMASNYRPRSPKRLPNEATEKPRCVCNDPQGVHHPNCPAG